MSHQGLTKRTIRSLRSPLLDNQLIKPQLLRRPLQHALLDTSLSDKPKHIYLLHLSNSMFHGLQIGLWVPIRRNHRR
jgi:hypothetical protein